MYFLSDSYYKKPQLIEKKIVKHILCEKQKKNILENQFKIKIIDLLKQYYLYILFIIMICVFLYWRYTVIKNIRKQYIINAYNN